MEKKKWYAVYLPRETYCYCFLLHKWEECQQLVRGGKNVLFKKFSQEQDAKTFLNDHFTSNPHLKSGFDQEIPNAWKRWQDFLYSPQKKDLEEESKDEKVVKIYTDGSFLNENDYYSAWGFVAILNGKKIGENCGISQDNNESRNIAGELIAVVEALQWFIPYQKKKKDLLNVCILHDYVGIAHWSNGSWKAKTNISIWYQSEMYKIRSSISAKISFQKVAAHSGNKWNEYIDKKTREHLQHKTQQLQTTESLKKRSDYLFS